MKIITTILFTILIMLITGCGSVDPPAEPDPTPLPTPIKTAGDVWFSPAVINTNPGADFATNVQVHSGTQKLGAYGLFFYFNDTLINVATAAGNNGVEAGPQGFITLVRAEDPGELKVTGYDVTGTGPGTDLHVLTIHWNAIAPGTGTITMTVDVLTDEFAETIGSQTPRDGFSAEVSVERGRSGLL